MGADSSDRGKHMVCKELNQNKTLRKILSSNGELAHSNSDPKSFPSTIPGSKLESEKQYNWDRV